MQFQPRVGARGTLEVPNGFTPKLRATQSISEHSVQFYEDDGAFLDGLGEYAGSALGTGGACIVIATKSHREALAERLEAWGIDLALAARQHRYLSLDAIELLSKFMVDGSPDELLFDTVIEPLFQHVRTGSQHRESAPFVFGEMVALLWEEGKWEPALQVERLWNKLARRHEFSLRCAYPIGSFAHEHHDVLFSQVCAEHGNVIPTERYTSLCDEDERMRLISSLQQRAQMLQAVAAARKLEVIQRKQV
jgi:hypothetical protein